MEDISFTYEDRFCIVAVDSLSRGSHNVIGFAFNSSMVKSIYVYVVGVRDDVAALELAAEALRKRRLHGLFVSKGEIKSMIAAERERNPRGDRDDWTVSAMSHLLCTENGCFMPENVAMASISKRLLKRIEVAVNALALKDQAGTKEFMRLLRNG